MNVLKGMFYISLILGFIAFIYMRYILYMPGNGILFMFPAAVCIISVILHTALNISKKEGKNVNKSLKLWGALGGTSLLIVLLINFF
ncbi:hypothetical protein [Mangrovivirga cuniculi]|uniref:Uncharacterized protein n=1 Tax=Mangrovivirga cuniculi TaxID=2715131 RepID=A0A4D7JX51_9BACT|nr:hypothetical protein [Mangrovivirga cuniculi]QCK13334.1 hypothetical protein DCC35_00505 [Mangrovivirga cuniculi]